MIRVTVAKLSGDCQSWTFDKPFTIGRVPECEVFVQEEHVSRNHAHVTYELGQWVVLDLKSANGLYVQGERIDRIPVGQATTFRLGVQGPFVTVEMEAGAVETPMIPAVKSLDQRVEKYFKETPGETVGDHTVMVRLAIQNQQKKQASKWMLVVAFLALVAIGAGGYAYYVAREAKKTKDLAQDIFYTMKALDMEIAANPAPSVQAKRHNLEQSYDKFLAALKVYDPKMTEQERLVLRVARIFGECELNMPPGFVEEVNNYIGKWKGSSRMKSGHPTSGAEGLQQVDSRQDGGGGTAAAVLLSRHAGEQLRRPYQRADDADGDREGDVAVHSRDGDEVRVEDWAAGGPSATGCGRRSARLREGDGRSGAVSAGSVSDGCAGVRVAGDGLLQLGRRLRASAGAEFAGEPSGAEFLEAA